MCGCASYANACDVMLQFYLEALFLLFSRWAVDDYGNRTKKRWAQMAICDQVPEKIQAKVDGYQV